MSRVTKKIAKDLDKLIKQQINLKFEKAAEAIQAAVVAQYDQELVDVVTDRKSKTNPNYYRDDFIERLSQFEYVEGSGDKLTINIPDMETFDFSGRLNVIKHIMEGMAGKYVEINEQDYIKAFGKRPINEETIDKYVSPKERIYLIRYNNKAKQAEETLGKDLVPYPFSNTPPIKILDEGEKFVEDNMSRWIEEALEEAQKEFVRTYKGAKI